MESGIISEFREFWETWEVKIIVGSGIISEYPEFRIPWNSGIPGILGYLARNNNCGIRNTFGIPEFREFRDTEQEIIIVGSGKFF